MELRGWSEFSVINPKAGIGIGELRYGYGGDMGRAPGTFTHVTRDRQKRTKRLAQLGGSGYLVGRDSYLGRNPRLENQVMAGWLRLVSNLPSEASGPQFLWVR